MTLDRILVSLLRRRVKGTSRLLRLLKHNQPYFLLRAKTTHGLLFNLDPDDHLDRIVLQHGYYEGEILETLLQYLGNAGVLWDIGANIGLHAITAKHLRPEAHVVCFEPSPFTFCRLYMNAKLNGSDLQMVNAGLGNSRGFLSLNMTISGNSGQTSFRPWDHVEYSGAIRCWCDTGADLVRQGVVPAPTVVKIDVEGFEPEVFSGLQPILKGSALEAIVFEAPADLLTGSHPICRILLESGFKIDPIHSAVPEENSLVNYVATR